MTPGTQLAPFEVFRRFLRFGLLAWGGPVAQIAMLKRDLVDDERWISPPRFNRLLAVYQLLPGPEAHELCVHLGMLKGGRLGGLLAGLGFMLPGLVLMLLLAALYQRLDLSGPTALAALLGMQLAVVALIFRAVHRLATHTVENRWAAALALTAAGATLAGVSFWLILVAVAAAYVAIRRGRPFAALATILAAALVAFLIGQGADPSPLAPAPSDPATSAALFLSGLKAGLLTFGGAYTAIPFVRADTVGRGWLAEGQFLDGLALSGIIPAPLIIFATFVGYVAGGLAGALAMTGGIFLPAFAFGLLFHERLEQIVDDRRLHDVLEGIAVGVIGLIAATALQLAFGAFSRAPGLVAAALIFAASLAALIWWKWQLNLLAVLPAAALAGAIAFR